MRRSRLVVGFGVALGLAMAGAPAAADSRVSFEVGGVYANSPVGGNNPVGGVRQPDIAGNTTAPPTTFARPADSLFGVELRPTFFLAGGMRVGIGFRTGKALALGNDGRAESSLYGGDVSVGWGRVFGRIAPFGEVRFGFNAFDATEDAVTLVRRSQLRLDAVLGARLYLSRAVYFAASAFAGWGDRYGGTLGLGWDIVHYRWKGALP